MKKNLPIYVYVVTLVVIVSIAISVVVRSYNKNKPVIPDLKYIGNMSEYDMTKIKQIYDVEEKKVEFIELCEKLELVIVNKLLDGSVTNENELKEKIDNINNILKSTDWTYLEMDKPNYWVGKWSLDDKGMLHFSFDTKEIEPDWVKDPEVIKYIY